MVKKVSGLRLAVLLLTLFLCVGCFIGLGNEKAFAADIQYSGTCGTCSWEIDTDGVLRIFPTDGVSGILDNSREYIYSDEANSYFPWYQYREAVNKVIVEDGVIANSNCAGMFKSFENCTEIDLSGLDTSNATDMSYMFNWCYSLTELDVSNFDTSNVTNMKSMFTSCCCSELDLSTFNTSNVTDMNYMFAYTGLVHLNISNFDTRNVVNMKEMFYMSTSLSELDLSSFNTSRVTNMESMFESCTELKTIYVSRLWDTSSVISSRCMFGRCENLVGAVAYDYINEDAAMANYETGYLTYKETNNNAGSGTGSTYQSGIDEVAATIAVAGVEDCTTVKAYQLVKGYYEKTADGEYNL